MYSRATPECFSTKTCSYTVTWDVKTSTFVIHAQIGSFKRELPVPGQSGFLGELRSTGRVHLSPGLLQSSS